MGKQHNISVHQKSNSSSLPATFANNYASNSQRLSQHKGVKDQFMMQKSMMEANDREFKAHEQAILQKQKITNKLFKNLPINNMVSQNQQ